MHIEPGHQDLRKVLDLGRAEPAVAHGVVGRRPRAPDRDTGDLGQLATGQPFVVVDEAHDARHRYVVASSRSEHRADRVQLRAHLFNRLVAPPAFLPDHIGLHPDPPAPPLRVDDRHTGGAHDDVIDVRLLAREDEVVEHGDTPERRRLLMQQSAQLLLALLPLLPGELVTRSLGARIAPLPGRPASLYSRPALWPGCGADDSVLTSAMTAAELKA